MEYKTLARNAVILAASVAAPIFCCEPNRGGCAVYGHENTSKTEYRQMQKDTPRATAENVTIEDRIQ